MGMMHATTGSTHDRNTPLRGVTATSTGSSAILTKENDVFSTGTQNVARSPMSAASWIVKTTHITTAARKNHADSDPVGSQSWYPVAVRKIPPVARAATMHTA